jgi:hypothetical protein
VDLKRKRVLEAAITDVRPRAVLNSVTLPHSGDWLNAIPSTSLGLKLHSAEFRAVAQYRLGIPLYSVAGACLTCHAHNDVFGDHAIACATDAERIARHDHLRDVLFQAAQTAALAPVRERRDLFPYDNERPADVYIPMWTQGRDAALDVTVISPLQAAEVRRAAANAGAALETAVRQKMTKSYDKCRQAGVEFIPLAVETLGGWDQDAISNIRKLGHHLARHSSTDDSSTIRHLFQRLSIFLQRGNAILLLGRRPNFPPPDLVGDG